MAVELVSCIEDVIKSLNMDTPQNRLKISQFFLDNNWFGISINMQDLSIDEGDADIIVKHLKEYLSDSYGLEGISKILRQKFPLTQEYFKSFAEEKELDPPIQFYIQDFLAYYLVKDLHWYLDSDLDTLIATATEALNKAYGQILLNFLKWLQEKNITRYKKTYTLTNRYTLEAQNSAYELDDYLELLYFLFNDDYIIKNKMLDLAAKSKNYADTWLYLALHFICALRMTDLERIGHPILTREPEDVLKAVENGSWSSSEARKTLLSITTRLTYLNITPNKTKGTANVSQLKFHIPESCQVLIGTLLAVCEAHYQINNKDSSERPLVRKIADYSRIKRYMGDEIGAFFKERDFSSRSANKSYLQAVAMLADDVLEQKSELNIKGHFLAALARSHKGTYDEFAQTTTAYLKDAQLGQLKPEMVAKELFERGVLSMIPSMLLTIVTRGKYKELSPGQQTKMIKELNLSPSEIEKTLELSVQADTRSQKALKTVVEEQLNPEQLLKVCHRIGNGEAFSKQGESMCLLSALGKNCPFIERQHCVGCQYELQTKSTLLLLIGEFNRLNKQYHKVKSDLEKGKVRAILENQLKPCITEMLQALADSYGEQVLNDYEEIIKELVS